MTRDEIKRIILRFSRQWPVLDDPDYETSYLDRVTRECGHTTPDKLRDAVEFYAAELHRRARPTPMMLAEHCGCAPVPASHKPFKEPLFEKPRTAMQAKNLAWSRDLLAKMARRSAEITRIGWVTLPDGRCYAADRVPEPRRIDAADIVGAMVPDYEREPGEDDE